MKASAAIAPLSYQQPGLRRFSNLARHLRGTQGTPPRAPGIASFPNATVEYSVPRLMPISSHAASAVGGRGMSTATGDGYLQVERKEEKAVAIVRLNRPKALNALCDELRVELVKTLKELDEDDNVRAIVLTGVGKAFAAGADIKQMLSRDYAQASKIDILGSWNDVQQIRKPIIAAVNGYALGGGCELSMMCDIIIAAEGAKFGQPEILLGTIPGMGGTQRLTRAVGKSRAMEWILTGRQIDAQEAYEAGLVSRIVPLQSLESSAVELAEQISKFSSPAVKAAKECVNRAFESSLQEGLLFERRVFHSTFATTDRTEGMTAFAEKRQPNWKHQ